MQTWTNTTTTSAVYTFPMTITSGGVSPATPPRPQTPLEWLDGEIEKTCSIARSAS